MTQILIIKTSSMGDILHTLPAVSDLIDQVPGAVIDWAVEPSFAEIPLWHPGIRHVLKVPIRQFRKNPIQSLMSGDVSACLRMLRNTRYDHVIDAQGLIKSALLTRLMHGQRHGPDRGSAREPIASLAYQHRLKVEKSQHAVVRIRQLFAQAFDYECTSAPDYRLTKLPSSTSVEQGPYLVFIHATTWESKHWPEVYWSKLVQLAGNQGFKIMLPWGNSSERHRAFNIAKSSEHCHVLPKTTLLEMANWLKFAAGVVSVDTGLGHLTAALNVPCVSIYGPTDAKVIGAIGQHQVHAVADFACAPCVQKKCHYQGSSAVTPACYTTLPPEKIWAQLLATMPS